MVLLARLLLRISDSGAIFQTFWGGGISLVGVSEQFSAASDADLLALREQLGRPARDVLGIAARCVCGAPTVVATMPRLGDGTPFPTFYYLSHPALTQAASTLEAEHFMRRLNDRLADDADLAAAYAAAHDAYLADRDQHGEVPEIAGISAGGMPVRVKCLHALVGHSLAAGPGVNPIGDLALAATDWSADRCVCNGLSVDVSVFEV